MFQTRVFNLAGTLSLVVIASLGATALHAQTSACYSGIVTSVQNVSTYPDAPKPGNSWSLAFGIDLSNATIGSGTGIYPVPNYTFRAGQRIVASNDQTILASQDQDPSLLTLKDATAAGLADTVILGDAIGYYFVALTYGLDQTINVQLVPGGALPPVSTAKTGQMAFSTVSGIVYGTVTGNSCNANNLPPLHITTSQVFAIPGQALSAQLAATGGTNTGYSWRFFGISDGFSLSPNGVLTSNGVFAPNPHSADGSYTESVYVFDSAGSGAQISLIISPQLDTDEQKDLGYCHPGGCTAGEPVDIGSGNEYEQVSDYQSAGSNKLSFTRYYNSLAGNSATATGLGLKWRSTFDRDLKLTSSTAITAERADGKTIAFTGSNGIWTPDTDVDLKLTQSGSNYTLTDENDTVETYTATSATTATLASIQSRNGYTQTLNYSAGQLSSVTDSFGLTLQFAYQGNLLNTVSTPDGLTLTYGYDSSGVTPGVIDRLVSIAYSTTPKTSQTYVYENSAFPFALTGIIDENGNRFATWTYDASGLATSSQHAGGADLTTISYNADGSRTVTNALGQVETYSFTMLQGVPKVTQISRIATASTAAASRAFTYDSNGYTASETDWNGNLTSYVNDPRGLPTSITEAAGTAQARTKSITYDPTFHLPTKIIEPGLTTDFVYYPNGDLHTRTLTDTTATTSPYSTNGTKRIWTYVWNANGLLASVKGPRTDVSQTTTFGYDGSGTLTSTTNALGQQVSVTQHTPGGLPQAVVDANNVTTELTYDERLRLKTSTIDTSVGRLTTAYAYDAVGDLLSVTLPDGSKLTNSYDMAHRLNGITDLLNQATAYSLDAMGDRTGVTIKNASGTVTRTASSNFDALGRNYQNTGGSGQVTKLTLDPNGNAQTITDPLSFVTHQAFDPLNRRYRITDPLSGVTTTAYDEHDRVLSVTAANGAITSYVYDGFGDVIQQQSPDSGTTIYRYDLGGNLTQVTDARNIVQNNAYDALDRRLTTSYPGGAQENIVYSYDESGHGFGTGRLTSVTDQAGALRRSYDERGNLTAETRTVGAARLMTAYTYDAASRLASVTYPSGTTASYSRDVTGRTVSVGLKPQGATGVMSVVSNIGYQPFGPVSAMTFGNGVSGTRTFDLDYRLNNLTDSGVQNLTYQYDASDNVSSITDAISSASTQGFTYDSLNRLRTATGIYGSQSFTYDAVGNRLTQISGGTSTNYTYAPQSNRLTRMQGGTGTQVFSYTPAGSITTMTSIPSTRPGTGIAYNQAGRLARVLAGGMQSLAYAYDAFGHRLVKTGAGNATTLYQYDQGSHLLEEANGSGSAITDYVYLDDQPIATFAPSGNVLAFLHTDRLGTPQKATSSSQSVIWRGDYLPFGELNTATSQTAGLAQHIRFPGQEFEAETGWHQNGFRDYAPALGRYLESDPIGITGGLNAYSYGTSNPSGHIDATGLVAAPKNLGSSIAASYQSIDWNVTTVLACGGICIGKATTNKGSEYVVIGIGPPGFGYSQVFATNASNYADGKSYGISLPLPVFSPAFGFNSSSSAIGYSIGYGQPITLTWGIPVDTVLDYPIVNWLFAQAGLDYDIQVKTQACFPVKN